MFLRTKSPPLLLTLFTIAYIFASMTRAAPTGEMDLDPPDCRSIPDCLGSIERERDKLEGKNVNLNGMDRERKMDVYRPILQFIDFLTLLVDDVDDDADMDADMEEDEDMEEEEEEEEEDMEEEEEPDMEVEEEDDQDEDMEKGQYERYSEAERVSYWIRWQEKIERKLEGTIEESSAPDTHR